MKYFSIEEYSTGVEKERKGNWGQSTSVVKKSGKENQKNYLQVDDSKEMHSSQEQIESNKPEWLCWFWLR